jgi:3-hydroxyacyl-[acyl-carrier-protein] dehydratase
LDVRSLDLDNVLVDLEGIRRVNPQRGAMEQLTAIVLIDPKEHRTAGYKDASRDDFWVPGHMPGFPLMPGVIMCEAAAQLANYYCVTQQLMDGDFIGFGGMEGVRFRGPVHPGDRLVIAAHLTQLRKNRRAVFDFQGFVGDSMVVDGQIIGVPLFRDALGKPDAARSTP